MHVRLPTPITVQAIHKSHTLSPEFKKIAIRKLSKITNKYRIYSIKLICDVSGQNHEIKATIHMPIHNKISVSAKSKQLYNTIDLICKKIKQQCEHHLDKIEVVKHTKIANMPFKDK